MTLARSSSLYLEIKELFKAFFLISSDKPFKSRRLHESNQILDNINLIFDAESRKR